MNKKAIITGITGQDGAYLSAYLIQRGYQVTGLVRGYNHINTYGLSYLGIADKVKLRECDLTDISQIITVIKEIQTG